MEYGLPKLVERRVLGRQGVVHFAKKGTITTIIGTHFPVPVVLYSVQLHCSNTLDQAMCNGRAIPLQLRVDKKHGVGPGRKLLPERTKNGCGG